MLLAAGIIVIFALGTVVGASAAMALLSMEEVER
jgi:hypothetical protein